MAQWVAQQIGRPQSDQSLPTGGDGGGGGVPNRRPVVKPADQPNPTVLPGGPWGSHIHRGPVLIDMKNRTGAVDGADRTGDVQVANASMPRLLSVPRADGSLCRLPNSCEKFAAVPKASLAAPVSSPGRLSV